MDDISQTIDLTACVRKRPFMFIGKDGIVGLFTGIINEHIRFFETDDTTFSISIIDENEFSIGFSSKGGSNASQSGYYEGRIDHDNTLMQVLRILSDTFDIQPGNDVVINFGFDKSVIPDTMIDYQALCEGALLVAILNRRAEIITKDLRQKTLSQNYYHFPQGILYLFNRALKQAIGKPAFTVFFDDRIGRNHYQIGLAYRSDWYPSPTMISFANEINTTCGGSLIDGIIDGLISACKIYIKENGLNTFKVKRKKVYNGLIIVCAVKGPEFNYSGSFKERLDDEEVNKQAKKIVVKLVGDSFNQNKEIADNFLFRFDENQLVSKIY